MNPQSLLYKYHYCRGPEYYMLSSALIFLFSMGYRFHFSPSLTPHVSQATCVQYRLVVRDVRTLQILQLYTCLDQVAHMEWSSDSLFILCAMYKRGLVQVHADLNNAVVESQNS